MAARFVYHLHMAKGKKNQPTDADAIPAVDELTFEQALEQLETIIERVEAGELGLEQSLSQYEHGSKLIKHCRSVLDRVEKRIGEVTGSADAGLMIDDGDGEVDDAD